MVNDLLADTKAVLLFLLGAVMALMAWIGRRHLKEFDELKRNAVTREELYRLHAENKDRLDSIGTTVDRTDGRIDQLYRDLMK